MTDIEDLVRAALLATPTPSRANDPLGEIERRVGRARRRLAFGAVAGVAVALVAIVISATVIGSSHRSAPEIGPGPSPTPDATASPNGTVTVLRKTGAVAATVTTDGSLWTAVVDQTSSGERWHVIKQSADGAVLDTVAVPGPVVTLVAHESTVWALGGGDGGVPDGVLTAINVETGDVSSHHYTNEGPRAIAFVDADVWVAVSPHDRVDRMNGTTVVESVSLPSYPTGLAATNGGGLWVGMGAIGRIARVASGPGGSRLGQTQVWSGRLFGAAEAGHAVWTVDAPDRVIQLTPSTLSTAVSASYGYRVTTPGRALFVTEDGAGGLWVATTTGRDPRWKAGVAYFGSVAAVDARGDAQPTAFLAQPGIRSMTAAPDGGVVVTTIAGRELRWQPSPTSGSSR